MDNNEMITLLSQILDERIGMVTAYAYAKSKGYSGSADDFANDMANIGVNISAIETAINTFNNQTVPNAETAITTAGSNQVTAVNTAGQEQLQNVTAEGGRQVGLVEAAGSAQTEAVNTAGNTQTTAVNNAGSTQVSNVNNAGSQQITAIQQKGEETRQSIPADYTDLSDEVVSLKSVITKNLSPLESLSTTSGGNINAGCGHIGHVENGKTYVLSFVNNTTKTSSLSVRVIEDGTTTQTNQTNKNLTTTGRFYVSFTASVTGDVVLNVSLGSDYASQAVFTEVQLEEGELPTWYAKQNEITAWDKIARNDLNDKLYGVVGMYGEQTGNYVGNRIDLVKHEHSFNRKNWGDISYTGTALSSKIAEGMAIHNGIAFCCVDGGDVLVIDLSSKSVINTFSLPNASSTHHCNSADFSDEYYASGDTYPLLYISQCNGSSQSACYVYRVTDSSATLIQTITFSNNDASYTGSFDWILIRTKANSVLYLMTWGIGANGKHPVRIFPLPSTSDATVNYSNADVIRAFNLEDCLPNGITIDTYQGHTVYGNYLFLLSGEWQNNKVICFDAFSMEFISVLYSVTLMPHEFEDCHVYDNKLYVFANNGNYGRIYIIDFTS